MNKDIQRAAWRLAAAIAQEESEFLLYRVLNPEKSWSECSSDFYDCAIVLLIDGAENALIYTIKEWCVNRPDLALASLLSPINFLFLLPAWAVESVLRRVLDSLP